jgi:hypothetical protein
MPGGGKRTRENDARDGVTTPMTTDSIGNFWILTATSTYIHFVL